MKQFCIILLCILLTGCSSKASKKSTIKQTVKANTGRYHLKHDAHPERHHIPDLTKIKEPIPRVEPHSRYGNPASYVVLGKKYHVLQNNHNYKEFGIASWYGTKFHGFRTSSGEPYDMYALTAAHKTLRLPCYVRVTNLDNNKSIIVKVTDRGPFPPNRLIDLSYAAAVKLEVIKKGTARVKVEAINPKSFKHAPLKEPFPAETLPIKSAAPGQYLQVAAFRQMENAEKLVIKIKDISSQPIFIKQDLNNKIYKVHIGPLDANNANTLISKLSSLNLNPQLVSLK